jgi:hypothetical protein
VLYVKGRIYLEEGQKKKRIYDKLGGLRGGRRRWCSV